MITKHTTYVNLNQAYTLLIVVLGIRYKKPTVDLNYAYKLIIVVLGISYKNSINTVCEFELCLL